MSKILVNSKRENTIIGHEYTAYILSGQYRGGGDYDNAVFNMYTIRNKTVRLARAIQRGAVTRWIRLYQWPNYYEVSVTDSIKHKGKHYDSEVYRSTFYSLQSAVKAMYQHKSDNR